MCGIAGALSLGADPATSAVARSGAGDLAALVAAMTGTLRHRGPDASGVVDCGPVALGHTRLAIIDLSERGAQPMRSADGRWVLTYNGEVYNFRELRAQLQAQGRRFRSDSDTEVVLQAWAQWGPDCLKRFNGMFAFAIWDTHEQRLILARDRFGIKPLYWSRQQASFLFGSEIKALMAAPGFERRISAQGLVEYLAFGNALQSRTLFDGCHKLDAGCWLEIGATTDFEPRIRPYWTLADVPTVQLSAAEQPIAVREALGRAVDRHLIADVPVALFLSGGLDSSTLCALASRGPGRLRTISVAFEGSSAVSELEAARLVAKTFGADHHEYHLGFSKLAEVLEDLGSAHDQPFGDVANVPLFLLSRQVAAEAKVVLQGDGGDEIFGGYRRYRLLQQTAAWEWFSRLVPVPRRLAARSTSARRLRRMQDALGRARGGERLGRLLTEEWEDGGIAAMLQPALRERLARCDPFAAYHELFGQVAAQDPAQAMLWTDTRILLPDIFLEKVDRSTMANSVEVRVPFLDTELADLVMGLPSADKLRRGSKTLLREAMSDVLPPSILSGPKLGFGVPYGEWLAGPLADYTREALLAPDSLVGQLFSRQGLEQLCDQHMRQGYRRGFMLYKLLMLAIWGRQYRVGI